MANSTNYWNRLSQVIDWSSMSVNLFAYSIGLSRPDTLYRIKAGKMGLSQNLANRIVKKYPEISLGWLLSGEGDMLGKCGGEGLIPYFDGNIADVVSFAEGEISPRKYLHVPVVGECDLALRCHDEAMESDVKPGSIVFLKQIDPNMIIPGGIYVVVCQDFVLLRRVRTEVVGEQQNLILEASNAGFDSLTVAEANVVRLFKLSGSLQLY